MFSILALLCLLFAFGVLLYTFVWIAQLLARRAEEAKQPTEKEEDQEGDELDDETEEPEEQKSPEEILQEELKKKGGAMKTNATLGLILAALACLLVSVGPLSVGPLILTLSVAALYFCTQAVWIGLRYFRTLVLRALIGVVLGVGSIGLQYLALTGQLAQTIPLLAP